MAREEIVISIRTVGAGRSQRDIRGVGDAANRAIRPLRVMQGLLAGFVGSQALRALVSYLDAFQGLQNRLRTVTDSTEELAATTNALFDIANRTRAPVAEIAELYQRGSIAADELGASNQQLLTFVEAVGNGLAIQGGSANTARGALLQLSQSLGSGIVRAEEFNSILEGAFPIAQAAARGLDEAGGSVARLRQLIIDGDVTSQEFFNAILSQSDELAETFGRTNATIGQALTQLNNAFTQFIGSIDTTTGISQIFVQVIQAVANNLERIVQVVTGLAASFAILAGPQAIGAVIAAVRALTVAIAANPIGALAVAITFVIGQLIAFRDEIKFAQDGIATLGDAAAVVWDGIVAGVTTVVNFFRSNFPSIANTAQTVFGDVDLSISGLLEVAARVVDGIVGFFRGGWRAIAAATQNLVAALGNAFVIAFNFIQEKFVGLINGIISGYNSVITFFGGEAAGLLDDAIPFEEFEGSGQTVGEAFASGFADTSFASDALSSFQDAVEARGQLRAEEELMAQEVIQTTTALQDNAAATQAVAAATNGGGGGGAAGATKELSDEMQRLNSLYDEVTGGADGLRQKQQDLVALFEQGRISAEQYAAAMRSVNVEVSALDNTFAGGLQNGFDRIIERANQLGSDVSDLVVGAFDKLTDTLVNFAKTGEFAWRDLFSSIFENLFRLAANQLFAQLLGGLGGGGGAGILGSLFGFNTGGSIMPTGSGSSDSQVVAFRKRPDERVDVLTPEQQAAQNRAGGAGGGGGTTNVTTNVAAVLSESDIASAMDTSEGETTIINVLQRNATTVRQIAGVG